jgi:hypothetical protein
MRCTLSAIQTTPRTPKNSSFFLQKAFLCVRVFNEYLRLNAQNDASKALFFFFFCYSFNYQIGACTSLCSHIKTTRSVDEDDDRNDEKSSGVCGFACDDSRDGERASARGQGKRQDRSSDGVRASGKHFADAVVVKRSASERKYTEFLDRENRGYGCIVVRSVRLGGDERVCVCE